MGKKRKILFILAALSIGGVAAWPHGGRYRGPGDTVPPWIKKGPSSPGGPSTPGRHGPATPRVPAPAGPATPNTPSAPNAPPTGGPFQGGRGPATRNGGINLEDYTRTDWRFWWEFNNDPYLT